MSKRIVKTHQIPELEIVEHLDVSLLGKLLLLVQLPPESIDCSHVQQLLCINLPCVAARKEQPDIYKRKFTWLSLFPGII
jgi:hypothetical protein